MGTLVEKELLGALVALDGEATARWYAGAEPWGCSCGDCRNFLAAARRGMLPGEIGQVLDSLGIPPEKATYVCLLYETDGVGLYQFSYRVAGRILRPDDGADWGCCGHEAYPYGAPGFPEPHFDLEFTAELPAACHNSSGKQPKTRRNLSRWMPSLARQKQRG